MTPNLIVTNLKLTDSSTKWGLVVVSNSDGTVNRQYTITGKEADAVAQNNKILPPGCTQEEWESGNTFVYTRPCNQGEACILPDGILNINYGVDEKNNLVQDKRMICFPGEWKYENGILYITDTVAKTVDVPFLAVNAALPV
jgi:hypothetical protein